MAQPSPSSSLGGFILSALLLIGGYALHQAMHVYAWGLVVMWLGLFLLLKSLLRFVVRALHSTSQINLLHQSRTVSQMYGASRLARADDAFIQRMAKSARGLFLGALRNALLFYDPFARGNGHMLTYAPSRTGKTISVVIPALLHWFDGSLITTDVKGELEAITARHRAAKGQRIVRLDPFGITGKASARFNPLRVLVDDILNQKGKNLEDLAQQIASQLASGVETVKVKDPFFRDNTHTILCALMLNQAAFDPANCHLPRLRALVWSTSEELAAIAAKMQRANWFGGLLKEYGNALADLLKPEYVKTYGPSRDIARKALRIFSGNTDFGKACMDSDFTLDSLLDGKTTVYVILPESRLETHGLWMGLVMMLLIEAIAAGPKRPPILLLLEEMGNLGVLPNLAKALSLLPGKNVRLWMIFQSRQQPPQLYGPEMAKLTEEQSSMIQHWAVRGLDDQKQWSMRAGTTTQKSYTLNHDPRDSETPWKLGVGERAAPVLPPDEVGTLPEDLQLIAIDGKPLIIAQKVAYFEVEPWRSQADPSPFHPEGYPIDKPVLYGLRGRA